MASDGKERIPGTPIGGEREYKSRRFQSPLHEFLDEASNDEELR